MRINKFFVVYATSLLYLPCWVFSLIDDWLWILKFSVNYFIFMLVEGKLVISFKIKKRDILDVFQVH